MGQLCRPSAAKRAPPQEAGGAVVYKRETECWSPDAVLLLKRR